MLISGKSLPGALRTAIVGAAVLFGVPLAFVTTSAVWRVIGWRTVASERKAYLHGASTFGYTLQRPLGRRDDILLTFSGSGFSVRLQSPGLSLNSLLEQRWFCDDRAVYLSMSTKNDYGSYSVDQTVKVIFDFERSVLFTFNSPWRVGSPDNGGTRAINEGEFNELLQRLVRECRPAPAQ